MGKPELCLHKRAIDGARCVLNAHPNTPNDHGFPFGVNYRGIYEKAVQALWDVWTILGNDTDGDTGPGAIIAGMGLDGFIEAVKRDAAQWRKESEADYDGVATEVERLRRWKAEATEVIRGVQDLGKALGLGLGERITGSSATEAAERLTAFASEIEDKVEAAAAIHRKMHSCGGAWYTMDPEYKGHVAWVGPCPTLRALGVTK